MLPQEKNFVASLDSDRRFIFGGVFPDYPNETLEVDPVRWLEVQLLIARTYRCRFLSWIRGHTLNSN